LVQQVSQQRCRESRQTNWPSVRVLNIGSRAAGKRRKKTARGQRVTLEGWETKVAGGKGPGRGLHQGVKEGITHHVVADKVERRWGTKTQPIRTVNVHDKRRWIKKERTCTREQNLQKTKGSPNRRSSHKKNVPKKQEKKSNNSNGHSGERKDCAKSPGKGNKKIIWASRLDRRRRRLHEIRHSRPLEPEGKRKRKKMQGVGGGDGHTLT